jgi:hypothetical protein
LDNISLILKHNTEDAEEKEGNSVKMTMWNLMNKEIQCYKRKQALLETSSTGSDRSQDSGAIDWDLLVPH